MPKPSFENNAVVEASNRVLHIESSQNPASRRRLVWFVIFAVLLVAVFGGPLMALTLYVAQNNLHSYIVLVPFVWAYLISNRRDQLRSGYSSSPGWAVIVALFGAGAFATAWAVSNVSANDYLTLMTLSFVCLFVAGTFLFLGRKWMSGMAFPFAFLIFLVPMPDAMAEALETASRLASTEVANFFFYISGTPYLRDGNIFQLPDITIQVAQECSGIRSSWILFITSLLAANLFLTNSWRRALLIGVVIPLGIIRNGFRVWVIGSLCIHFGPQMIHSIIHRRGGPAFFVLSLIPLFLLLWWLRRGEVRSFRRQMTEDGGSRGANFMAKGREPFAHRPRETGDPVLVKTQQIRDRKSRSQVSRMR